MAYEASSFLSTSASSLSRISAAWAIAAARAGHKGFLRIRIDIGPRLPEFANQRERLLFLPLIFLTVFLVIEADRFPFPVEFVFNQLDPLVVEALLLATYGRLILFCELVDGSRFGIGRRAGRVFQQLGLLRHGSQFRPLLCEELQKCPEVATISPLSHR